MPAGRRTVLVLAALVAVFALTALAAAHPVYEEDHEFLPDGEVRVLSSRYFEFQRAFPGKVAPAGARLAAARARQQLEAAGLAGGDVLDFKEIGPAPMTSGPDYSGTWPNSGRVSALAIAPTVPPTIYLGAAQGGIWRSRSGGVSWTPISDDQASLAIGSITIDPASPNTLYAGTGEETFSCSSYFGSGILKSTDAGDHWTLLGEDVFKGRSIGEVIVQHPAPGKTTLLAITGSGLYGQRACEFYFQAPPRGVWRSTDDGKTWEQLKNGLPKTSPGQSDLSASDLVADPSDPHHLLLGLRRVGMFESTNGGDRWHQVTSGLPSDGFGRIALGLAPSDGDRVYAAYEDDRTGDVLDLFRSDDGGHTWQTLPKPANGPPGYDGQLCQCFYDNYLAVHPTDPDTVYWGAIDLYKSYDGGQTWIDLARSDPNDGPGKIHVDQQSFAFFPGGSRAFLAGNDGGVYRSPNGGASFIGLNRGLGTAQFVGVTLDPHKAKRAIGGTQDNGTLLWRGELTWDEIDGGDGGQVAIDPRHTNVMYHTYYYNYLARSTNNGATWQLISDGLRGNRYLFYAPLAIDANDPNTIYFGSQFVNRSTDRGEHWQKFSPDLTGGHAPLGAFDGVSAIDVSPADSGVVWAGSADGLVWRSKNGRWQNVTGLLPNRFVADFAPSESNPDETYVAYTGFETLTPRRPGHIFHTTDGGKTWENLTFDLPDIAVNAIALDPADGTLYAGTDVGVFELHAGDHSWRVSRGIPTVAVVSLSLNRSTGELLAGTHGRSAFVAKLPATP